VSHRALTTVALRPVPLAPELSAYQADRGIGLFDLAGGGYRSDEPPPFWAFAWAGGQALARCLLDDPRLVAGRRVLDVACGGGVVALAAARAGAAKVRAVDVDPAAVAAVARNAAANALAVDAQLCAALSEDGGTPAPAEHLGLLADAEVLVAGDAFYSRSVADRMTPLLLAARRAGVRVLVGDPGRGYFPERLFARLACYDVPVPAALEETAELPTSVWEMRAT
jgi:predicted nicotinamide N-methyase